MNVHTGLELADHKVVLAIGLDTLDGEAANPGVDLSWKLFGIDIAGLQVERLLAVEGEDLGGRQDVALVKDGQAGVLIGNIGGLLPSKLDGVADDVLNGEVAHSENGRQDGAAESASAGNGLVGVHGVGQSLAKEGLDTLLQSRNTRATTHNLDNVDVLLGELGLSQSLLQRHLGAGKQGLNHSLEFLTGDHCGNIDIVHQ